MICSDENTSNSNAHVNTRHEPSGSSITVPTPEVGAVSTLSVHQQYSCSEAVASMHLELSANPQACIADAFTSTKSIRYNEECYLLLVLFL